MQGLPHPLLSGPSLMLGSSCGQRETASICHPSQKAGAGLAPSSLTATPHILSAGPVCPPCQVYLRPLPVVFFFFKKPQLPALFSHHPLPLSHTQAPGMSHLYHPVTLPPPASSSCPILLPVPPSTLTSHLGMSDQTTNQALLLLHLKLAVAPDTLQTLLVILHVS